MRTGIEQLRQLSQCQRREHVSRCRGESIEQLPKLGGAEGGWAVVGEMVHLDPGSEASHELESQLYSLRLGREADIALSSGLGGVTSYDFTLHFLY